MLRYFPNYLLRCRQNVIEKVTNRDTLTSPGNINTGLHFVYLLTQKISILHAGRPSSLQDVCSNESSSYDLQCSPCTSLSVAQLLENPTRVAQHHRFISLSAVLMLFFVSLSYHDGYITSFLYLYSLLAYPWCFLRHRSSEFAFLGL